MGPDFKKTLVLDSSYMPRSIISSNRAFVIVYKGNADVVANHDSYFKLVDEELKICKPSIIRIPKYVKSDKHKVPLTKANVFKRDGNTCVYCGEGKRKDLTIDHVVPKSKGGKDTWKNLVTACFKCNNKKASLSLKEFGAEIPQPKRPHYLMLLRQVNHIYEEWKIYLSI
jgi:5-methylcytosine-specific restriction endonuclease McrA